MPVRGDHPKANYPYFKCDAIANVHGVNNVAFTLAHLSTMCISNHGVQIDVLEKVSEETT